MPESVSIDKEHGVIRVDSTDLVEKEDMERSLEAVLQIAREQGLMKIMVDATSLGMLPSIIDLHSFASELSRRTKGMRHAIVVSEHSPKNVGYVETVAQNRGAIIRTFFSKDEALAWLNQ